MAIVTPLRDSRIIEDSIPGEETAFTLDENSLIHIKSVLTKIAEDQLEYLLREYSVNARDSHVEAKQQRPIEVTLPSQLSPLFIVKDYGVGLSAYDLIHTISKYGASTKRESNLVTGSLGLGSKSALTYTQQFYYICVKDGTKTTALLRRDDEDGARMKIVSMEDTDEPNGVEVQIPIASSDFSDLEEKARKFFSYWQSGTVLLNNTDPAGLNEAREVFPNIFMVKKDDTHAWRVSDEASTIVMGNVPYPLPSEYAPLPRNHTHRVVAYVPISSVNHTPSREALELSKKTKTVLEDVQKKFNEALRMVVINSINQTQNAAEAFKLVEQWKSDLPSEHPALESLTYRGQEIPQYAELPVVTMGTEKVRPSFMVSAMNSTKLSEYKSQQRIAIDTLHRSLQVFGHEGEFSASHKRKLQKYVESLNLSPVEQFVLTYGPRPVEARWVPSDRIVNWSKVKDIKLPRAARGTRVVEQYRLKGSYDLWDAGEFKEEVPAEDISKTRELYYVDTYVFSNRDRYSTNSPYFSDDTPDVVNLLTNRHPDAIVVRLGLNRVEKFLRDFPHAKEIKPQIIADQLAVVAEVTAEDRKAIRMYKAPERRLLKPLDASKVDDPALKAAIKRSQQELPKIYNKIRAYKSVNSHFASYDQKKREWISPLDFRVLELEPKPIEIVKEYALLDSIRDLNQPHTYIYINAVYNS